MMNQHEVNNLLKSISHDYRAVKLPREKTIKVTKAKRDLFNEYCEAYVNHFKGMGKVEAIRVDFRRFISKKQNDEDKLYLITLYFNDYDAYSFYIVVNVKFGEHITYKGIKFEDGTGKFSFNTSNSEAGIRLDAEHEALFKLFIKNKFKIKEQRILEDK